MHIKVNSEDELKEIAATLIHISVNLRESERQWHEHHGATLLNKKKYWEKKMDDYLEGLKAIKTVKVEQVQISIKAEEDGAESNKVS